MPQSTTHPKILERAKALRQRVSAVYMRALEAAEFANRARQRSAQLLTAVSSKMPGSRTANANRVQFLKVDLDVALTFARIALHARRDHAKRTRNQANARKAHDAVVHWKNRLEISEPDAQEIDAKLQELRAALEKLGETI